MASIYDSAEYTQVFGDIRLGPKIWKSLSFRYALADRRGNQADGTAVVDVAAVSDVLVAVN